MIAVVNIDLFLAIWVDVAAMSLLGMAAALIWAVRAKQFRNQDYARYLPLKAAIPEKRASDAQDAEGQGHG